MHPWFRAKNARGSHHRFTGTSPAFPAQWFYGFLRALLGDRAFLPPSLAGNAATLTPASGRQDHTTSPSAAVSFVARHGRTRRCRVHRIPHPTFVTMANAPLSGRDGAG